MNPKMNNGLNILLLFTHIISIELIKKGMDARKIFQNIYTKVVF